MTIRDWLWTVAAGVCLCLTLGCRHQAQTVADSALFAVPAAPAQIHTGVPTPVQGSPYHPRPHDPRPVHNTQTPRFDHPLPFAKPALTAPPNSPPPPVLVEAPKPKEGPPLVEALACLLQKQPDEARRWLERYEAPNRELLSGLLSLAVLLAERQLQQADPQDVDAVLLKLDGIQAPLRPRAALTISKMRFCKWIEKYGDYEPLPESHQFRAGDFVQVYVELRNFTCERQGAVWHTRLASTIEILDAEGAVAWRKDLSDRDRPERSHTALREYFRNYRFYVPEKIPPGLYTLRIHVTDVPTGRTVRGSLDFRITTVPGRS